MFQNGNAAFMRNWPYAWSLGNAKDSKISGKIGVSALPKGGAGGQNAATLGGWQLAVSKYSKNPAIAADLVMFMTSAESQKYRAINGSYNPTIAALYKDKDVLAANPFFGSLYDVFTSAVPRPATATGAQVPRGQRGLLERHARRALGQGHSRRQPEEARRQAQAGQAQRLVRT